MKFKDLKVGQRYRRPHWKLGTISEKIQPYKVTSPDGREAFVTSREVQPPTGIGHWDVKDNDEVIPL